MPVPIIEFGAALISAGVPRSPTQDGATMKVQARLLSGPGRNDITLQTNDSTHAVTIPPKSSGRGSSANGGELLFLAVATCYCNDIYREAARRKIDVVNVDVVVEGEFGGEGEPARSVTYRATVTARASESQIRELMLYTDGVAEIQNTLRTGMPVTLLSTVAVSV
jgi:organic hydroperoxide reductase OsmC/OhrA